MIWPLMMTCVPLYVIADSYPCWAWQAHAKISPAVLCAEPSETGMAVKALQALLPRARVLYSSATGASEPTNLAYMTRIGSWGFPTMLDMIRTLGRCRPRPVC